jgi:hypothetical protein
MGQTLPDQRSMRRPFYSGCIEISRTLLHSFAAGIA